MDYCLSWLSNLYLHYCMSNYIKCHIYFTSMNDVYTENTKHICDMRMAPGYDIMYTQSVCVHMTSIIQWQHENHWGIDLVKQLYISRPYRLSHTDSLHFMSAQTVRQTLTLLIQSDPQALISRH